MGPVGFAARDSSGGTMGTSLPALGAQVWHRVGVAEPWCCPVGSIQERWSSGACPVSDLQSSSVIHVALFV